MWTYFGDSSLDFDSKCCLRFRFLDRLWNRRDVAVVSFVRRRLHSRSFTLIYSFSRMSLRDTFTAIDSLHQCVVTSMCSYFSRRQLLSLNDCNMRFKREGERLDKNDRIFACDWIALPLSHHVSLLWILQDMLFTKFFLSVSLWFWQSLLLVWKRLRIFLGWPEWRCGWRRRWCWKRGSRRRVNPSKSCRVSSRLDSSSLSSASLLWFRFTI